MPTRSGPRRPLLYLVFLSLTLLSCGSLSALMSENRESRSQNSELTSSDEPSATESAQIECPQRDDEENLLFYFDDIEEMALHTPIAGAGARPLLVWDPIESADHYGLVIYDSSGEPYWAWIGSEAAIYLGGTAFEPPMDGEGPVITNCMSWMTTAYDENGVPVAAGGPRQLSP